MPISNAEAQARHRARIKAKLAKVESGLTAQQIADRDAMMCEPIWPCPPRGEEAQIPKFLGWHRYDWSVAPRELAEHLGMTAAWEGWQAEQAKMNALMVERANAAVEESRRERLLPPVITKPAGRTRRRAIT